MDYTYDQCLFFFSKGQVERMRATLALYRSSLGNNTNTKCQQIESMADKEMIVYPNPGEGIYTLRLPAHQSEILSLKIYNSIGQLTQARYSLVNDQCEIDLTGYPAGVYYLVSPNNKVRIVKIR